jgi:DNA-binding CsgD family transcriptional regulator
MLNQDCKILLVSNRAQSLIQQSPLFSLENDGLHLIDEKKSDTFKNHIFECCSKNNTHDDYSVFIEDTQTNQIMRLSISPLPSSLSLNNLEVNAAMVIIHSNQFLNIESLQKEYGLTRKESDVVQMFFEMRSIEEVAEYLGCAKFTVRNHLQALYKKLRINSQVELMSTLKLFLN